MTRFIVVGAGSSGCVLANRLSEDPRDEVLLIEAGPRDTSPLVRIPKGFGKLIGHPKMAWKYSARAIGTGARQEEWVRGRVLGGSSAINGLIYNRGSRADYDGLVELGNPGWGWDDILPIFRKIEDHALGSTEMRGSGGPVGISVDPNPPRLCTQFIESASRIGMSITYDLNGSDNARVGVATANITNGRRNSSAYAFLRPVRGRRNLTVLTNTTATCVLFEGDKAVGVEIIGRKGTDRQYADQVILSLGGIGTPQLLQLSGIGDPAVLRAAGVDVRVDSPNVGRRLREHRCVAIQFRLIHKDGYNHLLATPLVQARTGLGYLLTHRGAMATPSYNVVGFFKTSPDQPRPDAQLLMAPFSAAPYVPGKPVGPERQPGIQALAYVLRPTSEGSLAITSSDPSGPLDIDPQFLATEYDRTGTAAAFRTLREVFAQMPIAGELVGETRPGADVVTDDEIVEAAMQHGYNGNHAVGTCAMGPDEGDVVDSQLRVRGVHNLRVMDCSVMPTMVAGNLNAPAMAMAWRAADMILADR